MKTKTTSELIRDDQRLVGASTMGISIPVYDDGFGPLWIHRDSLGISGIVRAQTWEDAYSICEDEFFPEADETVEELQKEYGVRREHRKVIRCDRGTPIQSYLGINERFVEDSDYPLKDGQFVRWQTIEIPDLEAWTENELFQEAYGFRPNGPNSKDKLKHGIYVKDLNGDRLEELTPSLLSELQIELAIENE